MSEQYMPNNIKKVLFPLQNSDGSKGTTKKIKEYLHYMQIHRYMYMS